MKLQSFSMLPDPGAEPSDCGIYVPFLALLLFAFFAVCGLALDGGTLFLRRSQLQVTADLATQAGLGYRALRGWSHFHNDNFFDIGTNGAGDSEVADRAREVVMSNILVRGFDPSRTEIRVMFGGDSSPFGTRDDRIRVEIDMRVPLTFMGHLPGLSDCDGNGCVVRVASEAQLQPANIMLALDVSGSMKCPDNDSDDPPCQCRNDPANPECSAIPLAQRKLNKLVAPNGPLVAFAKFFNPNRDRIGVVPFHTTAKVALSILNPAHEITQIGARIPQFQQELADLTAGGNTNSSDALWRAYTDISGATPTVVGKEPFFMLLFSDGADTAGRFKYDLTAAAGDTLKDKITLSGENDWTQYKVEYRAANGTSWVGPSPLIRTSQIPWPFVGGEPDSSWTTCGRRGPMESNTAQMNLEFRNGPDADATKDCLKSFGFHAAFQDTPIVGGTAGQTDEPIDFASLNGVHSSYYYLQQYSHASLEIADFIRTRGGLVYAIGLGPKAPVTVGGVLNNDPHQNVLRDFEQKIFFFERLTADVYHGATLPLLQTNKRHPGFEQRTVVVNDPRDSRAGATISVGYAGHKDWEWLEQNLPRDKRGEYLQAENVDQLTSRFTRVAKEILLRLMR